MERKTQLEFGELQPSKELIVGNEHWFKFSPDQTGITLIGMEDLETGVVLTTGLVDPDMRSASFKAWAGARQSRAPGYPWQIMNEMVVKDVDVDEKMRQMFVGYGHASVGDMASLQVDLSKVPIHMCFNLFGLSAINSGQEKSTRYQGDFRTTKIHPIENYLPENIDQVQLSIIQSEYQRLADESLDIYARNKLAIEHAFRDFYKSNDKKETSSLNSRVLDCVRSSLLFGNLSGMSFESSARDFSRIIALLKASPTVFYQKVGAQMERFLAPDSDIEEKMEFKAEAPSLIRHTEPQTQINENINELKNYLVQDTNLLDIVDVNIQQIGLSEQKVSLIDNDDLSPADKMASQYILSIWPGLDINALYKWIKDQPIETKKEISAKIFNGQNNYKEMSEIARTSGATLRIEGSIGEVRDLWRHRAVGRFVTLPVVFGEPIDANTAYQILAKGYVLPSYLTEIPEFKNQADKFRNDLDGYYKNLYKFMGLIEKDFGDTIDYSFVINLLPLAHKVDLFMHTDPKQALYMTHQRVRNGGHINYRLLAYDANQLLANSDPMLSGLRLKNKPDPRDRTQFFDRS